MVIGRRLTGLNKVVMEIFPVRLARPMIKYVKNHNGNNGLVGVEIGTAEGFNALNMLKVLPIKKLYLVDSYASEWDVLYDNAVKLLEPYADKIVFVRKDSADAIVDIPNGLDFVYVDANHDYDFVKHDFDLYYPKVKHGGVVGGHDFGLPWSGVIEFVLALSKVFPNVHTSDRDWWVVKND